MRQFDIVTHRSQCKQVQCLSQSWNGIQGLLHLGVQDSIIDFGVLRQRTDLSQRIVGIGCRTVCLVLKICPCDDLNCIHGSEQHLELPDLLLISQELRELVSRQIEFSGLWCGCHQNASGSI